ncbi:hypothetical protein O0I10_008184 [Lichtheimia ornata]|uniref:Uncharacterized protein n=1 Tax=Lichtheimia ornata TaxID=688661 RepID=A0AAD7V1X6_9FUNG|nr:uncharacterized protein O0I10_008184 [Lichtheimia ornata]KAJ8656171.1 hypothetical protein O0I10_008184 [Lichtheimia ornata]
MDKRGQGDQEKDRLPRWRFRKERKLALRKAHRQRMAQARDQKKDRPEEEELEAHSHYIQQKRQWEEREKRYDMINLAKKRAAEAERLAKEASKKEWRDTLLRIPMLPPSMRDKDQQDPIRHRPQFISSSSERSQDSIESEEPYHWP